MLTQLKGARDPLVAENLGYFCQISWQEKPTHFWQIFMNGLEFFSGPWASAEGSAYVPRRAPFLLSCIYNLFGRKSSLRLFFGRLK